MHRAICSIWNEAQPFVKFGSFLVHRDEGKRMDAGPNSDFIKVVQGIAHQKPGRNPGVACSFERQPSIVERS